MRPESARIDATGSERALGRRVNRSANGETSARGGLRDRRRLDRRGRHARPVQADSGPRKVFGRRRTPTLAWLHRTQAGLGGGAPFQARAPTRYCAQARLALTGAEPPHAGHCRLPALPANRPFRSLASTPDPLAPAVSPPAPRPAAPRARRVATGPASDARPRRTTPGRTPDPGRPNRFLHKGCRHAAKSAAAAPRSARNPVSAH